jgi:hypothetical protein
MLDLKELKNLDVETLLSTLGLQRTSAAASVVPVVGGLVVGAIAGAALALIFAPQSGADLRRRIRSKANDVRADAEKAFQHPQGKTNGGNRPESSTP